MASSVGFHENEALLKPETKDRHRALASLQEELEAIDWYDQRVDATDDPELKAILAHNRDEEREHAMMVLEWLRRKAPGFEEQMRTYLFTEGPILAAEAAATEGGGGGEAGSAGEGGEGSGDGSLGIGSLRQGGGR
ncbi:MAG TPA: ferritin-like domain-containing protein [Methylomirabilota bacterium]|nr:ferritin-like domain-containing protein [Methylomirabilota bacterium]